MSLIRIDNVHKSFAGAPVLSGVSLRIEEGEKVGLIGRNGTGKSTIFRLILGQTEPDSGVVERMRKARFASLAQMHEVDPEHTIFDIVMHNFHDVLLLEQDLARLENLLGEGDESVLEEYGDKQEQFTLRGGYEFRTRIKQVLQGLGFHPDEFNLRFHVLSGGQRTRLMLALVLLQDADMLLLDEPENHLDLEAREWLEDYLTTCPQAVLVVSHDRRTLNTVAQRICELERGEVRMYTGNYDSFAEQKEVWMEQQMAAYERQQEHIRKEMVWINRFKYKATKARQAQSRMKRLDKVERLDAPIVDNSAVTFNMGEIVRSGAVVLDVRDLSMGYDRLTLYKNVSFQVERGERVGIIGPNGAGKSTLLKHIVGRLQGLSGDVIKGNKVVLGYYDQNHEDMNPANDILNEVHQAKVAWTAEQIRKFLGKLLFTNDDVFKNIKTLSGGELSRVAMAKLILSGANVLLLDEPTNHLDIASREALEVALAEFPGAIIMISHDRSLIDRLVDKLVIIENGKGEVHLGNYSDYRWKFREAQSAAAEKGAKDVLRIRRTETIEAETPKPKAAPRPLAPKSGDRKTQRKQEELEVAIERLENEVRSYDRQFAECDPADYGRMQTLKQEYDEKQARLQGLYADWEGLTG